MQQGDAGAQASCIATQMDCLATYETVPAEHSCNCSLRFRVHAEAATLEL